MYDFQRDLQMLNVGDFHANDAIPWDPSSMDRQFGLFGFGSCFGLGFGSCFGLGFGSCFGFGCFGFGGFRCGGCGGFGFRCGGFRCGGCGRCGRCFR
ncbi:heterocycloanthracin/sonorensin family bacteriocin [Bacillus sp. FJAT-29790]|uniref:heterocycloanthracin/sonorensin family bacteriocin n=1 Tax=Bacillus sp. FJAT-29790 TaxID=1895002 RepID=UPI001C2248E4|nr:heterocycloanthracin/sonorensin family bacteriocin [Bacillus sp. FJAT-29790]MBU8878107.1 heterocycloanthracin/sonorensin family bacteriocin [Bacillus sp. FJAT-29790]